MTHVCTLSGTPGDAGLDLKTAAGGSNDNGRRSSSDADDDDAGDRNCDDGYVSNLFARFAARVPPRSPVRSSRDDGSDDNPEPRETTGVCVTATTTASAVSCRIPGTGGGGGGEEAIAAAVANRRLAVPVRGATESEGTRGGDDDVGGARKASSLAAAPSSPSPTPFNSFRGTRGDPADQSSAGGAGDGIFDGYRASFAGNRGDVSRCSTATGRYSNNPERRRRVAGGSQQGRKSGGAGDKRAGVEAAAGCENEEAGAGRVAGVVGVGVGVTTHIFEQFVYAP